MDRNEAASVIRKYLTCTDITHSCNGKCEACRYHTNDDEKELALRLAIKALEGKDIDVPTKWIPVSERLPETSEDILILLDDYKNMSVGRYYAADGEWYADFGEGPFDGVVAWMPLPAPWKENGAIHSGLYER